MTRTEEAKKWLREELERLRRAPDLNGCPMTQEWAEQIRVFTVALEAIEAQDNWISVEDRLPEDDLPLDSDRVAIKVLTVTKHGKRRFVRELTRQRWEWRGVMRPWCWSKDAIGVTHWMPMPEPPKEDA